MSEHSRSVCRAEPTDCVVVEAVREEVALLEAERESLPKHASYGIEPGFQHHAMVLRERANRLRAAIGDRPVGWYQSHDYGEGDDA